MQGPSEAKGHWHACPRHPGSFSRPMRGSSPQTKERIQGRQAHGPRRGGVRGGLLSAQERRAQGEHLSGSPPGARGTGKEGGLNSPAPVQGKDTQVFSLMTPPRLDTTGNYFFCSVYFSL